MKFGLLVIGNNDTVVNVELKQVDVPEFFSKSGAFYSFGKEQQFNLYARELRNSSIAIDDFITKNSIEPHIAYIQRVIRDFKVVWKLDPD